MLFFAAALFVGSQQCRDCHAEIYASYALTPMAKSSGAVTSVPSGEFAASGQRYRVAGNRLFFDQGSAAFDYVIGSGEHGRTYLFAREGFLFELPVSWYAHTGSWAASPGYEQYREARFDRPVDPSCLWCHASQVRSMRGTQNRYGDPPFAEDGVGCERCHGPGSEHVSNPTAARMVNPAALDAERRDSVCSQCHLTGVSRVSRAGQSLGDFRAGDRLADYATYFVWDSKGPGLTVTSHAEALSASRCKAASGDRLWCGTCHQPHTNGNRTQAACLNCHAQAHHAEESCAACHMPKAAATDVAHGIFTDHRIPRRPGQTGINGAPRRLVAFLGIADDRALGLAKAEMGEAGARELLLKAQPADADVLVRLAVSETDPRNAVPLYETVLKSEPANTITLVNLGALYGAAGRWREAAALWRRALDANPALEGAALNLSRVLQPADARSVLARYLTFNPGSKAVRERLEALQKP